MPPIPFFGNVEDGEFLAAARSKKWRLLGFDHETFTYRYAGRDFRLTDVTGKIVNDIIA